MNAEKNTQTVGYIRVSSIDQNPDRQLESLEAITTKCFIDKASGRDANRPQLKELMSYVRTGDRVIVHSMDRLARNLDDLRRLVQWFTAQDIKISFIKEGLTFTGDDSPMAKLLLSVMGSVAEFERSLIKERQSEGIAVAKERGAYKGRQMLFSRDEAQAMKVRADAGDKISDIAKDFGVVRNTVYNYLKRMSR